MLPFKIVEDLHANLFLLSLSFVRKHLADRTGGGRSCPFLVPLIGPLLPVMFLGLFTSAIQALILPPSRYYIGEGVHEEAHDRWRSLLFGSGSALCLNCLRARVRSSLRARSSASGEMFAWLASPYAALLRRPHPLIPHGFHHFRLRPCWWLLVWPIVPRLDRTGIGQGTASGGAVR